MRYTPPSAEQLKAVKGKLGKTGAQMADLTGMKSSRRWREYTSDGTELGIPPANLFMLAALMCLPQKYVDLVLETMREYGAVIDLDSTGDSSQD
jgi:hypothetical protein